MRCIGVASILVLVLSGIARGQASTCESCLLGVYDDAQMTRVTGSVSTWIPKTVYLGIRLDAAASGKSLNFDVTYPTSFTLLDFTSYITDAKLEPKGDRGVQVSWPDCVAGTRLLFKLRAITFSPVSDAVLQIRNATLQPCSPPGATPVSIPGGCFVLNPTHTPSACALPVQPSCWGGVKELFR